MINGTLFVQMLNFYIGYMILTHILLKSALVVIMQQENVEQEVNRAIVDLKNQLVEHKEQQKKAWHECIQAFALRKPRIKTFDDSLSIVMPPVPELVIDPAEQEKLINVIAHNISSHITREKKV